MTSVLSLTIATSGSLTKVNSFYMLLDEALTQKKITPDILGNYPKPDFSLKTLTSPYTPPFSTWDIPWDTIVTDPASFADTGSTSIWRIKNDKYSQVMVGFTAHCTRGEYGQAEIRKNDARDNVGMVFATADYIENQNGEDHIPTLCTAPIYVSSGDYFTAYMGANPLAAHMRTSGLEHLICFWIWGWRRG